MSESVSNQELSRAFATQILNEYKNIKKITDDIKSVSTAPWMGDKMYDSLILKYSPNLHNATILLRFCTAKSINDNYEALLSYYCEALSLMEETAKSEIKKLIDDSDETALSNDFEKKLFLTVWHNGKELPIRDAEAELPKNKDGYYCVYFSENHTAKDVKWFIEHKTSKKLESNSVKIRNGRRKYPKTLPKKCIVGYLTILGMNGKDSAYICAQLFPEKAISYEDIYHIRSTITKNNWFDEADKEFSELINTTSGAKIITEYKTRITKNLEENNFSSIDGAFDIPRFLELSFSKNNNKFHLKMASDL